MNNGNLKNKVLLCADNRSGYEVLRMLLAEPGTEIVGVITHPQRAALYLDEICSLCENQEIPYWDITFARENFEPTIRQTAPDFLLSIYFDYILDRRFLDLPQKEAVNLHPGYLPYNKGFYYYVWALLDGTPAGVSIHRMAEDVDAGEIISQKRIIIDAEDTGETLYRKHEDASIELFKATWPTLVKGTCKFYRQLHKGTKKNLKKTRKMFQVDPYETVKAIDLINRLRILTFQEGKGCTIDLNGKRYLIHLKLEELTGENPSPLPGGFNGIKG